MATAAQKAEAQNAEEATFTFDGDTYTVDREIDLDVLEMIERRQPLLAMQAILGAEQWTTFKAGHSKSKDLDGIYDAYNEARRGNS